MVILFQVFQKYLSLQSICSSSRNGPANNFLQSNALVVKPESMFAQTSVAQIHNPAASTAAVSIITLINPSTTDPSTLQTAHMFPINFNHCDYGGGSLPSLLWAGWMLQQQQTKQLAPQHDRIRLLPQKHGNTAAAPRVS